MIAFHRAGILGIIGKFPFDICTTAHVLQEIAAGVDAGLPPVDAGGTPLIEQRSGVPASLAIELHRGGRQ